MVVAGTTVSSSRIFIILRRWRDRKRNVSLLASAVEAGRPFFVSSLSNVLLYFTDTTSIYQKSSGYYGASVVLLGF